MQPDLQAPSSPEAPDAPTVLPARGATPATGEAGRCHTGRLAGRVAPARCRLPRLRLWKTGTQTVFGAGPEDATAMLIGEQPGRQEDLAGEAFVGPSGLLLQELMDQAGVRRDEVYLTNTVKHFKFEQRGKVRMHQRASASEQAACRMWLAAEMMRVQPRVVVCLGAMAAQTVFGATFRVTRERGRWIELGGGVRGLAIWHPAAILRAPADRRAQSRQELLEDLQKLACALRRQPPRP